MVVDRQEDEHRRHAVGATGSIDASEVEDGRVIDPGAEMEGCSYSASGGAA